MTNEIKQLFQIAASWQLSGKNIILATVVHLEGSSYRRPGVRMIISDHGDSFGAVSGGCVEIEIRKQAQSIFKNGKAKIMNYDGRFRIGCEGIITLLLEPLVITNEILETFVSVLKERHSFNTDSFFYNTVGEHNHIGTLLTIRNKTFSLNPSFNIEKIADQACLSQTFQPIFQLHIFGAEHDAVHLCKAANLLGWEVNIVASPDEEKTVEYFPGANQLITPLFDALDTSAYDKQTAVVLMTHSFNKDVQYLIALKDIQPAYFGLLGPIHRRERVISKFLEYCPETSPEFLEQLHAPAGINIGAENASEIAISILAEILSLTRNQKPMALKDKTGSIHA